MINKSSGTGSDFLASLDIGKTFASTKEESTLKLSDLFKVFTSRSDSSEQMPKKEPVSKTSKK
jgi:hypothetical protein